MKNHCGLNCEKNCWYIGDRSEDEEAAMRAGVNFMPADIWRERFVSGEYRVNVLPTDQETQLIINWLKDVIPLFFDPIRDRVQDFINREYLDWDCLDYLGTVAFDDLTDHLERNYQPPEIEQEEVNWETVGRFLVERLKLSLWNRKPWAVEDLED